MSSRSQDVILTGAQTWGSDQGEIPEIIAPNFLDTWVHPRNDILSSFLVQGW